VQSESGEGEIIGSWCALTCLGVFWDDRESVVVERRKEVGEERVRVWVVVSGLFP